MAKIDANHWAAQNLDEVAFVLGVTRRTVQDYIKRGCPGVTKNYPIREIVKWCRLNVWKSKPPIVVGGEDAAMLDGPDSPALERWREARAAMAEMDLQLRQGEMLARSDVRELLMLTASTYRAAAEQIQRIYGEEACDIIRHALDAAVRTAERKWGNLEEAVG